MTASDAYIRLITDEAREGAFNMALDEALLEHVGRGASPPTLRLYRWDPPTISLGYFQPYAEYAALAPPAGALPVVRRQTGGGAILHDQELTYSLTLPLGHELLAGGARGLYEQMHAAIAEALGPLGVRAQRRGSGAEDSPRRGPFFCFARRYAEDLVLDGGKIAGSAQRRTKRAVLQHGSIMLNRRYAQQSCATAEFDVTDETIDDLTARIGRAFTHACGLPLRPGACSASESATADTLRDKYLADEWTRRR